MHILPQVFPVILKNLGAQCGNKVEYGMCVLYIALDKMLFSIQKYWFFYFSIKTYVESTHYKRLAEALLMSTHNICFHGEIRQIFTWYPLLSRPMNYIHADMSQPLTISTGIFFNTFLTKINLCSCLTLVLLNPDIPCLCKQCRSRSVGFWRRSQLIWICTAIKYVNL